MGFVFLVFQISIYGEFLVGKRRLEEETRQIAHHQHDEVAIDPQHIVVVLEVPLAKVEERLLHPIAVEVPAYWHAG